MGIDSLILKIIIIILHYINWVITKLYKIILPILSQIQYEFYALYV